MKVTYIIDSRKVLGLTESRYMTREDLREKSGLSQGTIGKITRGVSECPCTQRTAFRLAEALGVTVDTFARRA